MSVPAMPLFGVGLAGRGAYVFYLQLHGVALEYVVFDGVGNVERALRLDVSCRCTLPEGDAVDDVARPRVDEFELDVLLLAPHHLACAVVVHACGAEQRLLVAWSEGCKFLQVVMQFLRYFLEVDARIDSEVGLGLLGLYVFFDVSLEPSAELWNVIPSQRESCGIGMAAEVEQQVATALDGRVDV